LPTNIIIIITLMASAKKQPSRRPRHCGIMELKLTYAKLVTPRVETGNFDPMTISGEEMRKTRAKEDLHHHTAPDHHTLL
jgi:hypothetical protein